MFYKPLSASQIEKRGTQVLSMEGELMNSENKVYEAVRNGAR